MIGAPSTCTGRPSSNECSTAKSSGVAPAALLPKTPRVTIVHVSSEPAITRGCGSHENCVSSGSISDAWIVKNWVTLCASSCQLDADDAPSDGAPTAAGDAGGFASHCSSRPIITSTCPATVTLIATWSSSVPLMSRSCFVTISLVDVQPAPRRGQ